MDLLVPTDCSENIAAPAAVAAKAASLTESGEAERFRRSCRLISRHICHSRRCVARAKLPPSACSARRKLRTGDSHDHDPGTRERAQRRTLCHAYPADRTEEAWEAARLQMLVKEKAFTRARD